MNDEPERIWAQKSASGWDEPVASQYKVPHFPEYVRADIHDRVCAEWAEVSQNNYQIAKGAVAERDALAAALQQVLHHCRNIGRGSEMVDARIIERCEDTAAAALAALP